MPQIDPILFVRSISAAQARLVLALLLGQINSACSGLSVEELEYRTGVGRKALYRACDELCAAPYNLLVRRSAAHNRAIWELSEALAERAQMGSKAPTGAAQPENAVPVGAQGPNCAGSIRLIDEPMNDVDEEEQPAENLPALQNILEGLSVLRGMRSGSRYNPALAWESPCLADVPGRTPARLALAWVVKAYANRERLQSPVGLVLTRLKTCAARSLPADWQQRLPAEYLRAIGLTPPAPAPAPETAFQPAPQEAAILRLYEENIGPLTPLMAECLEQAGRSYPPEWVSGAFGVALKNNARRWSYIAAVLDGWQRNGRDWKPSPTHRPAAGVGKHSQAEVDTMLGAWLEGEG